MPTNPARFTCSACGSDDTVVLGRSRSGPARVFIRCQKCGERSTVVEALVPHDCPKCQAGPMRLVGISVTPALKMLRCEGCGHITTQT